MDTLEYLHANGRTHCDLHADNLLVGPNIFADGLLIIDLGCGHRQSASRPTTVDRGPLALKPIDNRSNFSHDVERQDMQTNFEGSDFKALGILLLMMAPIDEATASQRRLLSEFARDLELEKITDWKTAKDRFNFVLDPEQLATRAERFLTRRDGRSSLIKLPATGPVRVGDAALNIINTDIFQRLRGIKQLSFCDWYFPGAVHTRFEHSLGVFGTVQLAIRHLSRQSEVRSRFSQENIDGLLLASLLHDVGHYPLAHVVEHYVSVRYPGDVKLRDAVHHSTNTKFILTQENSLTNAIDKEWGENLREEVVRNLDGDRQALSQVLDGPIDCDKLDYLCRDAHHCGVPFGRSLDRESIIGAYSCEPEKGNLVIPEESIADIVGMVIAQDQMLSTVYWAKTTRALFAMFHRFLDIVIAKEPERLEELASMLKGTRTEYDAFQELLKKVSGWANEKYVDTAKYLISLHTNFEFSRLYRPVRHYSYNDNQSQNLKHRSQNNIYRTIHKASQFLSTQQLTEEAEKGMFDWKAIRGLRSAYIQALKENFKNTKTIDNFDVLIDVPWGKPFSTMINVLHPNGSTTPITKDSHIAESYFSLPVAHNGPIRVYIRPDLYPSNRKTLEKIAQSAEDLFDNKNYSSTDDEEL
jgi:HD superfamily phosphohydrolase